MVSSLQRALVVCQEQGYNNEAFLVHLALAKRCPESTHLASCLKLVPKSQDCDALITNVFQFTKLAFEGCVSLIQHAENPDHKARAYCTLLTHFPERQKECLEGALSVGSKNDKVYSKIARTFESVAAAKEISSDLKRGNMLLGLCLKVLSTKSGNAKEVFLAGIVLVRNNACSGTLDLLRSIAIKAMVIKDKERNFYTHNYFFRLQSKETQIQAKHSKQLFKELIAFDLFQAANAVRSAAEYPVICVTGALMMAEEPQLKKVFTRKEMITYVRTNLDSLQNGSFKTACAIRQAVLNNTTKLPEGVQEDFVFHGRWIMALRAMHQRELAKAQFAKFAPSVREYWNSIKEADSEKY